MVECFTIWNKSIAFTYDYIIFGVDIDITTVCAEILGKIQRIFAVQRRNNVKKLIKAMAFLVYGLAILSAVFGAFSSAFIITHGNILDYISDCIGVADYQFWYYGCVPGKYMTVADIFSDVHFTILTVIFFLHGVYFLVCAIKKIVDDDSICKLFLHSTCYSASLIYVIGSGYHNYAPVKVIT